jgi:hypothetical protein
VRRSINREADECPLLNEFEWSRAIPGPKIGSRKAGSPNPICGSKENRTRSGRFFPENCASDLLGWNVGAIMRGWERMILAFPER